MTTFRSARTLAPCPKPLTKEPNMFLILPLIGYVIRAWRRRRATPVVES
jgi:hypothetical protein